MKKIPLLRLRHIHKKAADGWRIIAVSISQGKN